MTTKRDRTIPADMRDFAGRPMAHYYSGALLCLGCGWPTSVDTSRQAPVVVCDKCGTGARVRLTRDNITGRPVLCFVAVEPPDDRNQLPLRSGALKGWR